MHLNGTGKRAVHKPQDEKERDRVAGGEKGGAQRAAARLDEGHEDQRVDQEPGDEHAGVGADLLQPAHATAFSRSGISHPMGKLTAEIPKFKVPEETKELLEQLAHAADMTLTEFVRELCIVRAHGEDHVRSLHIRRIAVVAGMGEESG